MCEWYFLRIYILVMITFIIDRLQKLPAECGCYEALKLRLNKSI